MGYTRALERSTGIDRELTEDDVEADRAQRNMERLVLRRAKRAGLSKRETDALLQAFVSDDG